VPQATNDRVRGHAARLFFNLSFLRTNRPLFLRKGALEHIKRILRDAGDIHSPNSSGRKIVRGVWFGLGVAHRASDVCCWPRACR